MIAPNIKICLLIPYFGTMQSYIRIFIESVRIQKILDVIIFTDIDFHEIDIPDNVKIVKFTLVDFKYLIEQKLSQTVSLQYPYKLCDFRPAYGKILESYISSYEFWAFGDMDITFGRLEHLLPDNWIDYDVLTFREEWITGPFTILKNRSEVNNIFEKSKFFSQVFQSDEYCAFDECSMLFKQLFDKGPDAILMFDQKESFTWLIRTSELAGCITVFRKQIINERIHKHEYLLYDNGKLTNSSNVEFLLYHAITEKNNYKNVFPDKSFFPEWSIIPKTYYITAEGYFTTEEYLSLKRYLRVIFVRINKKLFSYKAYFIRIINRMKNS